MSSCQSSGLSTQSSTAEAIFPPRLSRKLFLYPNPAPLTLSRRERPSKAPIWWPMVAWPDSGAFPGRSAVGLSSWMLELIEFSTGLPWFDTIIAGVLFSRLLLQLYYNSLSSSHSATLLRTNHTRSSSRRGLTRRARLRTGQARGAKCCTQVTQGV